MPTLLRFGEGGNRFINASFATLINVDLHYD